MYQLAPKELFQRENKLHVKFFQVICHIKTKEQLSFALFVQNLAVTNMQKVTFVLFVQPTWTKVSKLPELFMTAKLRLPFRIKESLKRIFGYILSTFFISY